MSLMLFASSLKTWQRSIWKRPSCTSTVLFTWGSVSWTCRRYSCMTFTTSTWSQDTEPGANYCSQTPTVSAMKLGPKTYTKTCFKTSTSLTLQSTPQITFCIVWGTRRWLVRWRMSPTEYPSKKFIDLRPKMYSILYTENNKPIEKKTAKEDGRTWPSERYDIKTTKHACLKNNHRWHGWTKYVVRTISYTQLHWIKPVFHPTMINGTFWKMGLPP